MFPTVNTTGRIKKGKINQPILRVLILACSVQSVRSWYTSSMCNTYAKLLCLSTDITNVCFEKTRNGISNDNDTDKKINK